MAVMERSIIGLMMTKLVPSTWTPAQAIRRLTSGQAVSFIKRMLEKDKILVRFTPFNGNLQEFTFDIRGIDEASKPLRKECGW